jgi:hypothetical protein
MHNTARQTRENRTLTVDFQNETTYFQLLGDGKAFVECVLAFLLALGFQLAHKATCHGGGGLTRHSYYRRFSQPETHSPWTESGILEDHWEIAQPRNR